MNNRAKLALFSIGLLLANWVSAAETGASAPAKPLANEGLVAGNVWQIVISLIFVLATIFFLAWLVRRTGAAGLVGSSHMKIVAAMSVGPRERVLLVDVAGKQLLLGVAPGSVSRLHEFEQPVIDPGEVGSGEFGNKLRQILQADKTR